MDSNSKISRKDIREALVRAALKDEAFRESLLANPKFAVERALGTQLYRIGSSRAFTRDRRSHVHRAAERFP